MSVETTFQFDKIRYLDLPAPVCVDKESSTGSVVEKMKSARVNCVLVCEGKKLLGIFTTRDILNKIIEETVDPQRPISDFMSSSPAVIGMDASIAEAIRTMDNSRVRHLPLLDENGEVAGLISVDRIVRYLVEHLPMEVYNLPPHLQQKMTSAEGA